MTQFTVVTCVALINSEKEIFVAKRKEGLKLGGKWEFPGGKLEPDEKIEDSLKREIKEELNLEIQNPKILHIKNFTYPHGHVVILFYTCHDYSGEIELVDHDESGWFTIEEMQKLDLLPANEEAISKLAHTLQEL